jgi:hypothetical protein
MTIENDKNTLNFNIMFWLYIIKKVENNYLVIFNQQKKNWNQYYWFLAKQCHLVTKKIKFNHNFFLMLL